MSASWGDAGDMDKVQNGLMTRCWSAGQHVTQEVKAWMTKTSVGQRGLQRLTTDLENGSGQCNRDEDRDWGW